MTNDEKTIKASSSEISTSQISANSSSKTEEIIYSSNPTI